MATGFEADEEQLASVVCLKPLDWRFSIVGFTVQVLVANFSLLQFFLQQTKQRCELRKHNRFMPLAQHFFQLFQQQIQLRSSRTLFGIDQPPITGRLSQTQQRLQNVYFRPLNSQFAHCLPQLDSVMIAQLAVLSRLFRVHFTEQCLFGFVGQFL